MRWITSFPTALIGCVVVTTDCTAAGDIQTCATTSKSAIISCSRLIESGKFGGRNLGALYFNRGSAYEVNGDYERAISDSSRALEFYSTMALAFYVRGFAHNAKGEFDLAITDLNQAIRLNPKLAQAYNSRSVAYFSKGNCDRAIADASEAIQQDPKLAAAFANRGACYNVSRNYDRAIGDLNEAIRLGPPIPFAFATRGAAYTSKGDYERAIADLTEAVGLDPKNATDYVTRSTAYYRKGDYNHAVTDANQAVDLDPTLAIAFNNRGAAYARIGNYGQAILDLNEAIRLNPKLSRAYIHRGDLYLLKGDQLNAIKEYESALAIDPSDKDALSGLSKAKAAKTAEPLEEAISAPRKLQPYDNYDVVGEANQAVGSIDLQACSVSCQSDLSCRAYSFDKWQRQCFLKKTIVSIRFDPSFVSGVTSGASLPAMADGKFEIRRLSGKYFSGNVYRSVTSQSPSDCEETCKGEEQCIAFTYSSSEEVCRLLTTSEGVSDAPTTNSGFKVQVLVNSR